MLFRLSPRRRAAVLTLAAGLLPLAAAQAQQRPAPPTPWADDAAARFAATSSVYGTWLHHYRPVTLDVAALRPVLAAAAMEGTLARGGTAAVVAVPLPDGTTGRFRVVEAPVMAPELAAQFPQIKTYAGVGLDDPTASIRCDLTPLGFHAQILSRTMGTIYVDPVSLGDTQHYLSFYRHDMNRAARAGHGACGYVPPVADPAQRATSANAGSPADDAGQRVALATGTTLRSYRLALAATKEYVNARGGTATAALAAMTVSVNRVVGVYEKELAVRLTLVANTNLLIAATTTIYANNSGGTMLGQNQTRCDQIIGTANYDIGHVFSTGGGGIAGLGVVCRNGQKAQGVTGLPQPVGDAFDIDYVAHEMGHQFGGSHPFNSESGNCGGGPRNAPTSWEPGSGSTIMAYAGICDADNLQTNSDAQFHSGSYQEIQAEINTTSCFISTPTGNTPPSVTMTAVAGLTIPKSTPFRLTAIATDAENDALTYSWENMDTGGPTGRVVSTATNQVANQRDPLFRSFVPSTSPTRYFPQLAKIINGTTPVLGEALPAVTRSLKFRCTVRDEHVATGLGFVVGGVSYSSTLSLNVSGAAGPFVVQTPNGPGGTQLYVGAPTTVTWSVANTNVPPVNCSNVDILLSRNGGLTYPDTLAANVANTGTATFNVPASVVPTATARIMVHARGNVFFDISNANFSILAPLAPDYALSVSPATRTVCPGVSATYTIDVASLAGFTTPVALSVSGSPAGVTTAFAQTTVTPGAATTALTVGATTAAAPGTYPLVVSATDGTTTKTAAVTLIVSPQVVAATTLLGPADATPSAPLSPAFSWSPVADATTYTFELSDNAAFTGALLASVPGLTATAYPLSGVTLTPGSTYYWRVRGANGCGEGPASGGFSFTTVNLTYNTTPATGLPIPISSTAVASAIIAMPYCDVVQDVNVKDIRLTYANTGDLDIFLVAPTGQTALLASSLCPGAANLNVNFDDQAATSYSAIPCPTVAGATYRPLGGLARFNGIRANGNWTLRIVDNIGARNGSLLSWSLELGTSAVLPLAPTALVAPPATVLPGAVKINWTDNACNETLQRIERSVGGNTNFQPLTTVATNVATYTDRTVLPFTQYCYRVRAESPTQQSAYTPEVCVTTPMLIGLAADALGEQLSLVPNPSAGEFSLKLTEAPVGTTRLTVVDALGRTVQSATLTATGGTLAHTLDLRAQAKGVYLLRLTLPDGRTAVRRLMKL